MKRYEPFDFEEGVVDSIKAGAKTIGDIIKGKAQHASQPRDFKKAWDKYEKDKQAKIDQLKQQADKANKEWSTLFHKKDKSEQEKKKVKDLHKKSMQLTDKWSKEYNRFSDNYDNDYDNMLSKFKSKKK